MRHAFPAIDERAITCAQHRTTFYAAYPRQWSAGELLHVLAAYFRERGHHHVPFETIDLVPVPALSIAARPLRARLPGVDTHPCQGQARKTA